MAEKPMGDVEFKRLRQFIKPFSRFNVFVYQLTGGRLMGKFQGLPVVLVTMTGATSGKQRTIPLMYVPYNDGIIIVASLGGAPKSPVWYKNLVAHPDISVRHRGTEMKLRARLAGGEEKGALWPICDEHYAPYAEYRLRTTRDIPIFVCEPTTGEAR